MNKFIEYLCKLFFLVVFFRSTFPSDEIYDATHAKYSDFKTYDSKRGNKTMNVKCSRTIGITCIHSNSEICLYFPIFILSKIRYLCRFYRFFCKVRIGKIEKFRVGMKSKYSHIVLFLRLFSLIWLRSRGHLQERFWCRWWIRSENWRLGFWRCRFV